MARLFDFENFNKKFKSCRLLERFDFEMNEITNYHV